LIGNIKSTFQHGGIMKKIFFLCFLLSLAVSITQAKVSLITKDITIYPEKDTGKIARIVFNTDTPGAYLFLIKDEKGKIIRGLSTGKIEAGQHYVDWNGKDYADSIVPEGTYNVSIINNISLKIDETFGHKGRIGLETIEIKVSDPEKIICKVPGEIKRVFINDNECYKVDSFEISGSNYTFKDGIVQVNPASGVKKSDTIKIEYYYPCFLEDPWDLDIDANGDIYAIIRWQTETMKNSAGNLIKISSDGNKVIDDFAVKGKIGNFNGRVHLQVVVSDNENRIYICGSHDSGHGTGVFSLKTGAFLYSIGGWFDSSNPKTTYHPAGICLGPENKIYIRGGTGGNVSAYDRTKEKDKGFLYNMPAVKRHSGYPPLVDNYFGPSMESSFPSDSFYITTYGSDICKIKDTGKEFVELYYTGINGAPVGISYDKNTGLIYAALRTLSGKIAVVHDNGFSINEMYIINDPELGPTHTVKQKGNYLYVVEDGIAPGGRILEAMEKSNIKPYGKNRISRYLIDFEQEQQTCSVTVKK